MSETAPSREGHDTGPDRGHAYLRTLDLHDETGQILTAILVNLRRLGKSASAPVVAETVRDTEHLVELLFYAIRDYVREASGGRPASAVPAPDVLPAIERLAREFSRRTGIAVSLDLDPDIERVPRPHKTVFYRVAQEGLTNVLRHSAASGVTIRASRSGEGASLVIEDDGASGRAPARPAACADAPAGGSGLRGMRERVRLAGGECTVEMVEGRGMTVRVVLPYNAS